MGFPLVGVLGAGPEVRLAYAAANRLGVRFRVLATSGRDSAARVVQHAVTGDTGDLHVLQAFAEHCAVVLVADADVPRRHLSALEDEGVVVVPSVKELALLEDPDALAHRLHTSDIPTTPHRSGVLVLAARSPSGQAVAYPAASSSTQDAIPEVVVPAPGAQEDAVLAAQELALRTLAALDAVGVLTVEIGLDGARPAVAAVGSLTTATGAWTVEACITDAFQQHLRAALDLPLGSPEPVAPYAVTAAVIGREEYPTMYPAYRHILARDPALRVRMYGVDVTEGVAVGHVSALGSDLSELQERVRHAAGYLRGDLAQ